MADWIWRYGANLQTTTTTNADFFIRNWNTGNWYSESARPSSKTHGRRI